jgi:hypothetical protein
MEIASEFACTFGIPLGSSVVWKESDPSDGSVATETR